MERQPLIKVFITLLLAVPVLESDKYTSILSCDLFGGHEREMDLLEFISDMCGRGGPIERSTS